MCGNVWAADYTLGDYATDAGLTGSEQMIFAGRTGITDLLGLANNYDNLTDLDLYENQLTTIESGDFHGLTNLTKLDLRYNQIETMDLSGLNLSSLTSFNISNNPLTSVSLTDIMLSQESFDTIMDGGLGGTGIAELGGVLNLNMSGVDFLDISDFSAMFTMDDLEELLLIDAINLAGSDVSQLTTELDSLNFLNVTGLWDTFNITYQTSLNLWDTVDGNTLVTPEPATLSLLAIGALVLRRRKA